MGRRIRGSVVAHRDEPYVNQSERLTSYFVRVEFAKTEDMLFLVKEAREEVIENAVSTQITLSNANGNVMNEIGAANALLL